MYMHIQAHATSQANIVMKGVLSPHSGHTLTDDATTPSLLQIITSSPINWTVCSGVHAVQMKCINRMPQAGKQIPSQIPKENGRSKGIKEAETEVVCRH